MYVNCLYKYFYFLSCIGAVGFPLSIGITSSYAPHGNTEDDFVIDKYEAFLKPKNEKVDIDKYRGLDNMKFQLNQINMPAPIHGTSMSLQ
jgi:hypothetical protein